MLSGTTPPQTSGTPREAAVARDWHTLTVEETFDRLGANAGGLASAEVARRQAIYGPNRLPAAKPRSALTRFLLQFHSILIYVLIAAALITAALAQWVDAGVILAVVVFNAVIGFIQEGRAERALDAIRKMISPRATVIRDGRRAPLAAEELVPGDLVVLEAGDRVPADVRLLRVRNLRVDESLLTGESVPVEKTIEAVALNSPLGDRTGMAFSGTLAVSGRGTGVVVATGTQTELGRISTMLESVEMLTTPLVRKMNRFAHQLALAILAVSAVVFAFAVYLRDYDTTEGFMAAVALAVAAIPEGLPAVMTITLAIGVQRMAARHAIIRRLPAVETLGSVSVICSDKTGTFTHNEMTVRSVASAEGWFEVSGIGYEPHGAIRGDGKDLDMTDSPLLLELARAALLCNDALLRRKDNDWTVDGDPMEGALLSFAMKAGLDADATRKQMPRTDEIPFDAEHRFMATLHHGHEGGAMAYVKGAPETIVGMCDTERNAGVDAPLNRDRIEQAVAAMASNGQRVLALAAKPMPRGAHDLSFDDLQHGLVLLGLVGLVDPPREEAIAAVAECHRAGIEVKMITGDHAVTAQAIGKQLGLGNHDAVASGSELEALNDSELIEVVRRTAVFARASPEHKLRIVEALQWTGAVVAMTGDGVNDALSLKRADVGIAMGRKGTEAAKEAAEMILTDDNFASIVAAVREGRTVYDNLIKVIGYTLPTNGGEAFTIILAILLGLTLPVTPVQVLWINMVTAVTLGLTLAFEPTEPGTMQKPPRAPDEPILSPFLIWRTLFVSVLFVVGVFGAFYWSLARGQSIEEARTIAVNIMVVLEIFYLFSIRYSWGTSISWIGVLGTPAVLIGVGIVTLVQFAFTYLPVMQQLFATRPVSFTDGLMIVGIGVALFLIMEIEKAVRRFLWR